MSYRDRFNPGRVVTILGAVTVTVAGIRSPGVAFDGGAGVEVMLQAEFLRAFSAVQESPTCQPGPVGA